MGFYQNLRFVYRKTPDLMRERMIQWRKGETVTKVGHPTRLDKARMLGYKAKSGFVVARVRIKKGGSKRVKPRMGRSPSKAGRFFNPRKSARWIAEEKASRIFKNMEVLNSYFVCKDGKQEWFEVILVDPQNPSIKADRALSSVASQRGRAERGLTAAAHKTDRRKL
ncbi:MAG: 50S ribosomal protein L15e [Candidatus Aenigmarchaeota archaeon]|nr:50S ribosomal protein L15e [Candidatus Aenigmarchaeota archaeon]